MIKMKEDVIANINHVPSRPPWNLTLIVLSMYFDKSNILSFFFFSLSCNSTEAEVSSNQQNVIIILGSHWYNSHNSVPLIFSYLKKILTYDIMWCNRSVAVTVLTVNMTWQQSGHSSWIKDCNLCSVKCEMKLLLHQ